MYTISLEGLSDIQLLVLFPALACLLLWLVTIALRYCNKKLGMFEYDADVVDTATQNSMSGAYVVLGFVLAIVMTTASGLDDKLSEEAQSIRSLNRLLILEGSEPALQTRQSLINYVGSILQDEWPVLKDGHESPETSAALQKIFQGINEMNPTTERGGFIFNRIIQAADEVAETRNARILSVSAILPSMFYLVSVISILAVIIIGSLRLIEANAVRIVTISMQVVMLTLLLSATAIVDLPFLGDTTVSVENLVRTYDALKEQDQVLLPKGD